MFPFRSGTDQSCAGGVHRFRLTIVSVMAATVFPLLLSCRTPGSARSVRHDSSGTSAPLCSLTVGVVSSSNHLPVPDVAVDVGLGLIESTDADGIAVFPDIPQGEIHVRVFDGRAESDAGERRRVVTCHGESQAVVFEVDFLPTPSKPDPRIWLEPCAPFFLDWHRGRDWKEAMRKVLRLDQIPSDAKPVLALTAKPAFAPEWAIRVFQASEFECSIVFSEADYNLARALAYRECADGPCPETIRARQRTAPISCVTALSLREAWVALLVRLRTPREDDPVILDGVTYFAHVPSAGEAGLCGLTDNPPPGSAASRFASLAEILRIYADSKGEQRDRLEFEIGNLAEELQLAAEQP